MSNKLLIYELNEIPKRLVDYYVKLIKKFDIKSIEDPLHEDDWDGWIKLTRELNGVQIVGDDIFVTQRELLKKGIDSHAGNAILIKPNQVGTLTESLESIQLAKENKFNTIISHRSGETEACLLYTSPSPRDE